jgi:hypothetical protein
MTFSQFADRYPSTIEIEQLALINGVETDSMIDQGTFLKRVVGGELPER